MRIETRLRDCIIEGDDPYYTIETGRGKRLFADNPSANVSFETKGNGYFSLILNRKEIEDLMKFCENPTKNNRLENSKMIILWEDE